MANPMQYLDQMRRRTVAPTFRYLHDEISGGVFAYSHLKTLASYSGHAVNIGTNPNQTDYGFVDNIVDLAQVDLDFGSDQATNTLYDQFGLNDITGGNLNSKWNKTDNEYVQMLFPVDFSNKTPAGTLATLAPDDPFTVITVQKHTAVSYNTQEAIFNASGSSSQIRWMYQGGAVGMLVNSGSSASGYAAGFNDNNIHLTVGTYDGSQSFGGISVYVDDMATDAVSTNPNTGTPGTNPMFSNEFQIGSFVNQTTNTHFQGFIYETHIFNKVLSQAERETAKEILEQYYTFP